VSDDVRSRGAPAEGDGRQDRAEQKAEEAGTPRARHPAMGAEGLAQVKPPRSAIVITCAALPSFEGPRKLQLMASAFVISRFGISLFQSFDQHKRPGVVPMPSARESSRESHGGHAMLCVGYSDPDKLFIVRNSWGPDWGEQGYCYIPYGYLTNEKFNSGDSWILKQLENVDFDAGTWGDESSMIGELDTEFGKMSDDDYSAMLDAMGEVPLEYRLGLVFLQGAGADGDISDDELQEIAGYLQRTFVQIGSRYAPSKVLKNCLRSLDDEALLQESVALLGEHLPKSALASITSSLQEVVGVDGLSEEEESFVFTLVEAWQIEEGDDAGEDEDESEDEDEDEESEDEESEESEGEEYEEEPS